MKMSPLVSSSRPAIEIERGGLAAAGRADQGHEFAVVDGQGDVVDGDARRRKVLHDVMKR